jgi:hypothetical protein
MSIYGRDGVPANAAFAVNISGTAPPPNANGGGESGPQPRDGQSDAPSGGVTVQQIPGRLDVLKWPLIGGFLGVFALGAILLARRPVVAVAAVAGGVPADVENPAPSKKSKSPIVPSSSPNLADVDAAVGMSLDSLKDQIFRLELRRQAGTISEEEYTQERARAEKVLRDLVRG